MAGTEHLPPSLRYPGSRELLAAICEWPRRSAIDYAGQLRGVLGETGIRRRLAGFERDGLVTSRSLPEPTEHGVEAALAMARDEFLEAMGRPTSGPKTAG